MSEHTKIHIGTCGWHYRHSVGPFYSEKSKPQEWLAFYEQQFRTVEINRSFNKLPEAHTLRACQGTVPDDFIFPAKASRYFTHMKKLKDPQEPLDRLYRSLEPLGDQLGPILIQLPGNWDFNEERLSSFMEVLSSDHRHSFEFRDERWINDRSLELLAEHEAAFCIYDFAGPASPKEVTADFAYVRLHGPGDRYQGSYESDELAEWANVFAGWRQKGLDIYCYFDSDEAGYAAHNALALQEMVS